MWINLKSGKKSKSLFLTGQFLSVLCLGPGECKVSSYSGSKCHVCRDLCKMHPRDLSPATLQHRQTPPPTQIPATQSCSPKSQGNGAFSRKECQDLSCCVRKLHKCPHKCQRALLWSVALGGPTQAPAHGSFRFYSVCRGRSFQFW